MCFKQILFDSEAIKEMIDLIKTISTKLKAYKMFKVKDKRHVLITEKTMQSIC